MRTIYLIADKSTFDITFDLLETVHDNNVQCKSIMHILKYIHTKKAQP